MSFLGDYFVSVQLWKRLTPAQKKALLFPWEPPHPRVAARLTELGLWDDAGITRSGAVVALCRYATTKP